MAAVRSRAQQIGSPQWINDENNQVDQFCTQEAEDFAFSARNEVEWLNEHMAEIFSKNQVNVTEIFKTPGKLRGKTPRTARKRNPMEFREPLTDVFLTNAQRAYTPHKASPTRAGPTFLVAQDPIVPVENDKRKDANTDSGYHGLPEDDTDVVEGLAVVPSSAETHDTLEEFPPKSPSHGHQNVSKQSERHSTTERSFHSAEEAISNGDVIIASPQKNEPPVADVEAPAEATKASSPEPAAPTLDQVLDDAMEVDALDKDLDEDLAVDESRSPSQGSSPARPLVRKSSLAFAALPAREPLTTKKSIGARTSRTSHLDQSKTRGSFLGRFTGGKSLGGSRQPELDQEDEMNDEMNIDMEKPALVREESDGDSKIAQLHNKSSTQRLHDRINMLGKSQPARPTKSIPATVAVTGLSYPELPNPEPQVELFQQTSFLPSSKTVAAPLPNDEDDDDWIQPPQVQSNASNRPQLPKSISADVMEDIRGKQTIGGQDFGHSRNDEPATKLSSPLRHVGAQGARSSGQWLSRAATISQSTSPEKAAEGAALKAVHGTAASGWDISTPIDQSTTPLGSPSSRRYVDGPLSASKSKLQSIMKTARGLFSSSAGVSAQAKIETLSPLSTRAQGDTQGASFNNALRGKSPKGNLNKAVSNTEVRKTRSSTEKEERRKESEAREHQRTEEELERIREKEGPKSVTQKLVQPQGPLLGAIEPQTKPTRQSPRKTQTHEGLKAQPDNVEDGLPSHPLGPPASHVPTQQSQLQKPSNVRRPIKPAKETAPKPKPQPVNIRVGTLSQRIPLSNAALSSSLQESLAPSQPKQPTVGRKPSNASLQTSASNNSLKSSATSAAPKPKALLAAERKKEQDEREAQRKLDQKREIERKRAAQQEEARRQEQQQRQEAERQRERERALAAEDPKKIAQKQAIEKRRMELSKKEQQQRVPQKPAMDQAPISQNAHATMTSRPDMGGARPPSRLHNVPPHPSFANAHPQNPAKPANKRVFNPDTDDEPPRQARPQVGLSYQPNDDKRRRTEDEEFQEMRVRPTMAPPIRQSIRKDGHKASIFSSSYTTAPPPAPHHHNATSLLKTTTASQAFQQHAHQSQMSRPGHHPDIAKYTNGKIPFAEISNPPQANHKTPLPSKLAPPPAKASPHYQNGENIHLEEIPTESEESDSEDEAEKAKKGANLPEWAQSPQLRQLLMTQDENMDADAVFGPVASPHMEEMFKERHHRFRSRTSSANWAGADRLTEEEIRRDIEARQRLRKEGGWTFGL